jgi:hypothetical protein
MFSVETFFVTKIKVVAVARKHVVKDFCAQQGPGIESCAKQFRDELSHSKVYTMAETAKDLAHHIGQDLFKGKTPIGKRLREVVIKNSPSYFLNTRVDDDDLFSFVENLEVIRLRIKKVGLEKFCEILFVAGVDLMF